MNMNNDFLLKLIGMLDNDIVIKDSLGNIIFNKGDKDYSQLKIVSDDTFLDEKNHKYFQKKSFTIDSYQIDTYYDVSKYIEETNKYSIDFLTKLPARTKINEYLNVIAQTKDDYVVAIVDIDNFKSVNDNYGHLIGDKVIATIAQVLKNNIRGYDFAGRFGGEEFLLVFKTEQIDFIMSRLNHIREYISSITFDGNGIPFKVTVSIGANNYDPKYDNVEEKINEADQALYYVKNSGKNAVKLFNEITNYKSM